MDLPAARLASVGTYRDHAAGPDGGQYQQCIDCGKTRDVPLGATGGVG